MAKPNDSHNPNLGSTQPFADRHGLADLLFSHYPAQPVRAPLHQKMYHRPFPGEESLGSRPYDDSSTTYTYGPVSVPATSSSGSDYFNYSSLAPDDPGSGFPVQQSDPHVTNAPPVRQAFFPVAKSLLSRTFRPDDADQVVENRPPIAKKKSRKPGFHLPLDNLANRELAFQNLQHPGSSHSDSNFELLHTYKSLQILEPDLGFNYDDPQLANLQDNVTPLMKPPGSNTNGYFEAGHSKTYSGANDDFPYLSDSRDLGGGYLGAVDVLPQVKTSGFFEENGFNDDLNEYLNFNYDTDTKSDTKPQFAPSDLTGFDFTMPRNDPDLGDHSAENAEASPEDNDQFHQYNANETPYSSYTNDQNPRPEPETYVNQHLDLERPPFERTGSNQSTSSITSVGSGNPKDKALKKKRNLKGAVCSICDKYISRDLTRHMRIHNEVGRFQCIFPKAICGHKTGYFNRPYDFKKHLLHVHFKFDDPKGKTANTLTDKLPLTGFCHACGAHFVARDWLDQHVLTSNAAQRCQYVELKEGYKQHLDLE